MKKEYLMKIAVMLLVTIFSIAGCGYTTRSLLPSQFKTIYVENFVNKIKVTAESSDERMYLREPHSP